MTESINIAISPEVTDALNRGMKVIITEDLLSASVLFQLPPEELQSLDREQLKKAVLLKLRQQRVSYGFDVSVLEGELEPGQLYPVAQAKLPVDGQDAIIRMIELPDTNPEVQQDGSTNYYNINLMLPIAKDGWLGEKVPPTLGVAGVNIRGKVIPPVDGVDLPLLYDRDSVTEEEENGITVLRALRSGMLLLVDDKISVLSHRDFDNIDFSTGNIDFDGSITIRGTVMDGFSVRASGDISILGEMGVGAVNEIESLKGSVFIKGGISGNSKAVVRAAHDIFIKFVLDSTLECGGKINIGFFSRNSQLRAEELVVESSRGRIQGGRAEIGILITANEAGSEMEARTELFITGFKREALSERLENLIAERDEHRQQFEANRSNLTLIGSRRDIDAAVRTKLSAAIKERMTQTQAEIKVLENEIKNVQRYLRMPNEGEIRIRRINPNCYLSHNGLGHEIRERQFGKLYYCDAGMLMDKQL